MTRIFTKLIYNNVTIIKNKPRSEPLWGSYLSEYVVKKSIIKDGKS